LICVPEQQFAKAQQLADYALALSGVEIEIIVVTKAEEDEFLKTIPHAIVERNRLPNLALFSFKKASRFCGEQPMGWLEHDSIPLVPDWAEQLEAEYDRALACGKDVLLPKVPAGWDIASGIGIYPPGIADSLPDYLEKHGFDRPFYGELSGRVHYTPLIQHEHCYDELAFKPHRFYGVPTAAITPGVVIFHSDRGQQLIHWIGGLVGYSARAF
jgi:hypothetical protein